MQTPSDVTPETLDVLGAVLADALRALASAGEPEAACRLAGRAYVALRREHAPQAQRINVLMHRLVRIADAPEERSKVAVADAPAERSKVAVARRVNGLRP